MGQAFISYSRRDKEKVYAICQILTEAGITHWIDKNDIPPTEQWRAEIVDGIKNSDSFVLFISPASLNSENVIKELNIASEQEQKDRLRIIPVVLVQTEIPATAEYQLTGKQWVDLSGDFTKGLEDLIKALRMINLPKGYQKHLLSHLPGSYISPDQISPLPNPSREIVVGSTISIRQVRDQRFMPRPAVLAQGLRELDAHLKGQSREEVVNTFWIQGRSGSGKSVLLLQLMQEMVLQRHAQVFWFYSDEAEKIYDFFEKWASQGMDIKEPLFVFIDDFNTPLSRDTLDNKSISSLLRNPSYTDVTWPVLVTCSPPEYLQDFKITGRDEGFRIKEWEIPTFAPDESRQLIQWFETRTGKKSKTGRAFKQQEGLALSMIFELWYYSQYSDSTATEDVMKAFGHRFKTRLDALHLTDAMALILALNRLYVWPPNTWMEEMAANQRDAFNILVADKDFSILSIQPSPSGFVRLTHPHLSDVIYNAIRPKTTSRITRARDVADAFEKALNTNILVANQLLRIVSETIGMEGGRLSSEEIDVDESAKLFTSIWSRQHAINEDTQGLVIYAWINWAVWNSKDDNIGRYLNEPDLIGKSLHYLDYQHKLWGELWQKLWYCEPLNQELIKSGIKWLRQYQSRSGWSFVWRALLEHPDALPDDVSLQSLLQLGLHWLTGREDKDPWSFVWQTLLGHPNALPEGTTLQSLLQLGLHWLTGREDKDQWDFVWQALLQLPDALPDSVSLQSLLQLGLYWLAGREDKDQWAFVWQTLLGHPNALPEGTTLQSLLQLGLYWLTGREDKDQWSFVWRALLEHPDALPDDVSLQSLLQLGLHWLAGREDKEQWAFVWQALAIRSTEIQTRKNLVHLASEWLKGRENFKSWSYIYETCLQIGDLEPDFLSMGIDWIAQYPHRPETLGIAILISKNPEKIPHTKKMILQSWIKNWVYKSNYKDKRWTYGWGAYWKLMPALETVDLALKWIEVNPENISGGTWIIKELFRSNRFDVFEKIKKWHETHTNSSVSEIIRKKFRL